MGIRRVALALIAGGALVACADGPEPVVETGTLLQKGLTSPIVITEVMQDPMTVPDGFGEWFEVYNNSATPVNMAGWTVSDNGGESFVIDALTVAPNSYAVIGKLLDSGVNGGVPVDYAFGSALTLANGPDALIIRDAGGLIVDQVAWDGGAMWPNPRGRGRSMQLGAEFGFGVANEAPEFWCRPVSVMGNGELGTPGMGNDPCSPAICGDGMLDAGEACDDGNTDNGDGCNDQCQGEGTLVINEVMSDPASVSDGLGEWFELYNPTPVDIDLQGYSFADLGADSFTVMDSVIVPANDFAVLGRVADSGLNGGIEVDYAYGGSMLLSNQGDQIIVSDPGGAEIDRVEFTKGGVWPNPRGNGRSMQFDANADPFGDDNNDPANWCRPSSTLPSGDDGTPGAANDPCDIGPFCGDGTVDAGEACDDGNQINGDGCADDCTVEPACGDGNLDAGEECDDGNTTDGDGCSAACTTEFACGDGAMEAGEECDDGNVNGGDGCSEACTLEGQLVITEVLQDPTAVSDGAGEWFEVLNAGANAIDLAGWTFTDEGNDSFMVGESVVIASGDYAVLARVGDSAVNGGVEVDYVYGGAMIHANQPDGIVALDPFGTEIDRVVWDGGAMWPNPRGNGRTIQYGSEYDPLGDDNNDPTFWCRPTTVQPSGHLATPGAMNDPCSVCGDGMMTGNEACDDGNLDDGDGCASDCTIEMAAVNIVITEVMQDPETVVDGAGEWFELYNPGAADVDLDGWTFTSGGNETYTVSGALIIAAGDYLVMGKSTDVALNGNVPVDHAFGATLFLANLSDSLVVLDATGAEIDRIDWDGGAMWPNPRGRGRTMQLDGDLDAAAVDNNDGSLWCRPVSVMANGELGTPGSANDSCGAPPAVCGDGTLNAGEECDDGNLVDGDGCAADCTIEPACGDGTLDANEECDDGNLVDGDGCAADCTIEPACGDGTLDAGEECDDGNLADGDGCAADCTIEPACGDGTLDANEECDDGNLVDGDGCAADCTIEPACGDGTLDAGEECDDGNLADGDGCAADCTIEPACGDGTLDAGEECDDGNLVDGDGCAADCTIEPACGDGTLDANEECDDGNLVDGDGCAADCTIEPACGDGTLDAGEECDDGNLADGDGCAADCTIEPVCGDGTLDAGEECDDGNLVDGDGCAADCTIEPACGDGTLDAGEECDDGNLDNGDGCADDCTLEGAQPGAGDLVVTEIMQNSSAVGDADGEWFEVRNTTGGDLNLLGVEIRDDGADSHIIDVPFVIPPGYFVFARNGDMALNGGVPAGYEYAGFFLANGGDEVELALDGVIIDRVAYDGGPVFPDPAGAAMQFGGDIINDDNNDGSLWCAAFEAYGDGDLGTPGLANPPCPLPPFTTQEFQDLINIECAGCHTNGGASGNINLDDVTASINVVAFQTPDMDRIEPGDPQNSYLFRKLEGTQVAAGGGGGQMPRGGPFLPQETLDRIAGWITNLAP